MGINLIHLSNLIFYEAKKVRVSEVSEKNLRREVCVDNSGDGEG
jgi:hypothetical protein